MREAHSTKRGGNPCIFCLKLGGKRGNQLKEHIFGSFKKNETWQIHSSYKYILTHEKVGMQTHF